MVEGDVVYVGGHGPIDRDKICGKVGASLSVEQARDAARMTALSILAALDAELGELARIERIALIMPPQGRRP